MVIQDLGPEHKYHHSGPRSLKVGPVVNNGHSGPETDICHLEPTPCPQKKLHRLFFGNISIKYPLNLKRKVSFEI